MQEEKEKLSCSVCHTLAKLTLRRLPGGRFQMVCEPCIAISQLRDKYQAQ